MDSRVDVLAITMGRKKKAITCQRDIRVKCFATFVFQQILIPLLEANKILNEEIPVCINFQRNIN